MAGAPAKFCIDVSIHNLLMNSDGQRPIAVAPRGLTLPEPVFPQFPTKLTDPGPEKPHEGNRKWSATAVNRTMRGWLWPYMRSRVLPGDFHPVTSYLFVEYRCNLDCWYCWSFDNGIRGMTEDTARRSIDWLYDHGCRVLACMGGEPLLRPDFIHKVVYYAAKKGFWIYIATNGRLLKSAPGIVQDDNGELRFAEWSCRAGQDNFIIRTDGTVAPCFPMYSATYNWGNIENFAFDREELLDMKKTCQKHCFSTLNHNLAYCYDDARVIKWMWENVKLRFRGERAASNSATDLQIHRTQEMCQMAEQCRIGSDQSRAKCVARDVSDREKRI